MRHAGVGEVFFLPYDRETIDRAVLQGRALCEVAADSALRLALAELAAAINGSAARPKRRRLSRMLR